MTDLYIAFAILAVISAGLFVLGLRVARGLSLRLATTVALLTVIAIFLCERFVLESVFIVRLLPFSNLVVLGNVVPPLTAFLAGIAWRKVPGGRVRRLALIVPLALVSLYHSYGFLVQPRPASFNFWRDGVCFQTSASSCSAACAATLLRLHGIESSELEMIDLCLTRNNGTTYWGLHRGLALKTAGTGWRPEAVQWDFDELRRNGTSPVILRVQLIDAPGVDPRYRQRWGWEPGVAHTVVFLGFRGANRVQIADPTVGREFWDVEALRVLWHGQGMRLVETQRAMPKR